MSEFSYVLSRHVHGKNIKTYALAQYCGLDRSNMYKIINGKRKPTSLEMVHKMARFMHLSPAEEQELEEAKAAIGILGGKVEDICRFTLPDGAERAIAVIRKIRPTPKKFPRPYGKIKKNPLNKA